MRTHILLRLSATLLAKLLFLETLNEKSENTHFAQVLTISNEIFFKEIVINWLIYFKSKDK